MIKIIRTEDIDNFIKNYHRYKGAIKRLEDELLEKETEINKVGGGIVKVTKDRKPPNNLRMMQLFHELSDIQDEISDLNTRIELVDEFVSWLKEESEIWHKIVEYRIRDWSYEQIGVKVNYSFNGVRKIYFACIKEFLKYKSVNYTTKT